jgi:hypothetical protein
MKRYVFLFFFTWASLALAGSVDPVDPSRPPPDAGKPSPVEGYVIDLLPIGTGIGTVTGSDVLIDSIAVGNPTEIYCGYGPLPPTYTPELLDRLNRARDLCRLREIHPDFLSSCTFDGNCSPRENRYRADWQEPCRAVDRRWAALETDRATCERAALDRRDLDLVRSLINEINEIAGRR